MATPLRVKFGDTEIECGSVEVLHDVLAALREHAGPPALHLTIPRPTVPTPIVVTTPPRVAPAVVGPKVVKPASPRAEAGADRLARAAKAMDGRVFSPAVLMAALPDEWPSPAAAHAWLKTQLEKGAVVRVGERGNYRVAEAG
jgi:hypothetical protein